MNGTTPSPVMSDPLNSPQAPPSKTPRAIATRIGT